MYSEQLTAPITNTVDVFIISNRYMLYMLQATQQDERGVNQDTGCVVIAVQYQVNLKYTDRVGYKTQHLLEQAPAVVSKDYLRVNS